MDRGGNWGKEKTYANHKEHTGKNSIWHGVKDCQERSSHCPNKSQPHHKVTDALLDNCLGSDHGAADLRIFPLGGGDNAQSSRVDSERVGMDGRLGHETVGHGEPQDSGNERGAAQEEEVPVKTTGFLQWKLSGLGRNAADVLEWYVNKHGVRWKDQKIAGSVSHDRSRREA